MIGRSDAHSTFREMRIESPKRSTIRQKDREVIQTESSAIGVRYARARLEGHQWTIVPIGAERRGVSGADHAKADYLLVVGDRSYKVADLHADAANMRCVRKAKRRRCNTVRAFRTVRTADPVGMYLLRHSVVSSLPPDASSVRVPRARSPLSSLRVHRSTCVHSSMEIAMSTAADNH